MAIKYKLINKETNEEHLCEKVSVDGFDYYYINETIPYNKEGTEGKFICLSEIIANKNLGLKLGDKQYVSPFVNIVGNCTACRKLIATNNSNIDIPKVVDEVEILAPLFAQKELNQGGKIYEDLHYGFVEGYNKSQETHPFSEEDMLEFSSFYTSNMLDSSGKYLGKSPKELLQIWREQQPKIVYYNE